MRLKVPTYILSLYFLRRIRCLRGEKLIILNCTSNFLVPGKNGKLTSSRPSEKLDIYSGSITLGTFLVFFSERVLVSNSDRTWKSQSQSISSRLLLKLLVLKFREKEAIIQSDHYRDQMQL